jgi:polyisoprenoid-binding protein YceI
VDEQQPENSKVDVKIDAATINTREAKRDEHLRSADFFDVAKYPTITYVSTKVKQNDPTHLQLFGDLTIREVSKEVVLDVEFNGQAKSPWGTTSAGFSAKAKMNRKDWHLEWNKALETGGVLVGDEINIEIELELVKPPEG